MDEYMPSRCRGVSPVAFATIFPVVFPRCAPIHHLRLIPQGLAAPQCPCFHGVNYLFTQVPRIRLHYWLPEIKSGRQTRSLTTP